MKKFLLIAAIIFFSSSICAAENLKFIDAMEKLSCAQSDFPLHEITPAS